MFVAFEIAPQRIADDGVEVDPPALGVEHRAAVQVAAGAHVEAALQRHIGLTVFGLAKLKIIVHSPLKRCLEALGVIALIGHQVADELEPPMQHLVITAVLDRAEITFVFQHRTHIKPPSVSTRNTSLMTYILTMLQVRSSMGNIALNCNRIQSQFSIDMDFGIQGNPILRSPDPAHR